MRSVTRAGGRTWSNSQRKPFSRCLEARDRRGRGASWARICPVRPGVSGNPKPTRSRYVSFHWGTTNMVWDLRGGKSEDGTMVRYFSPTSVDYIQLNKVAFQVFLCPDGSPSVPWRIWKLIPVRVEGAFSPSQSSSETLGSGSLPSYDGSTTGQSSTRTQHTESEHDRFGTIVNEVTVNTVTTTTHKRYRVENA